MTAAESRKHPGKSARLSAIMQRLSSGDVVRAEDLAEEFGVSVRSIYRDMDSLKASGMPIEATQGTGYQAKAVTTLPPLHLTESELEALHLGLLAVAASADEDLQNAAQTVSQKLEDALPQGAETPSGAYAVYPFDDAGRALQHLATLRSAIRSRQMLRVTMGSGAKEDVRPLRLEYWGRVWTLLGYADGRKSFVKVPVHDILNMIVLPGLFVDEGGKGADDLPRATLTTLR
ncbi:helix-turn-helix transcriptional regulator [Cognatishimia activa]|nr:HTH domain-containing protein [Cognatishimia activa]